VCQRHVLRILLQQQIVIVIHSFQVVWLRVQDVQNQQQLVVVTTVHQPNVIPLLINLHHQQQHP
jgi:predicted nuclease of predicted toxin-antitoxin system